MNRRKLAHRHIAKAWRNLTLDNLAVAHRSLVRNPPFDIDREPMLKVFGNTHLRRVNVSPFVLRLSRRFSSACASRFVPRKVTKRESRLPVGGSRPRSNLSPNCVGRAGGCGLDLDRALALSSLQPTLIPQTTFLSRVPPLIWQGLTSPLPSPCPNQQWPSRLLLDWTSACAGHCAYCGAALPACAPHTSLPHRRDNAQGPREFRS